MELYIETIMDAIVAKKKNRNLLRITSWGSDTFCLCSTISFYKVELSQWNLSRQGHQAGQQRITDIDEILKDLRSYLSFWFEYQYVVYNEFGFYSIW
jgi:hypothetical protein